MIVTNKSVFGNEILCGIQICNNYLNNPSLKYFISYYLGNKTQIIFKVQLS